MDKINTDKMRKQNPLYQVILPNTPNNVIQSNSINNRITSNLQNTLGYTNLQQNINHRNNLMNEPNNVRQGQYGDLTRGYFIPSQNLPINRVKQEPHEQFKIGSIENFNFQNNMKKDPMRSFGIGNVRQMSPIESPKKNIF